MIAILLFIAIVAANLTYIYRIFLHVLFPPSFGNSLASIGMQAKHRRLLLILFLIYREKWGIGNRVDEEFGINSGKFLKQTGQELRG